MHTRRWIRRGVAGMSLTIPLALAPRLDVTIREPRPTLSENNHADRVADVEDVQARTEGSGRTR
jgi:hypothetical protein